MQTLLVVCYVGGGYAGCTGTPKFPGEGSSSVSRFEPAETNIRELVDMGFSRNIALFALKKFPQFVGSFVLAVVHLKCGFAVENALV